MGLDSVASAPQCIRQPRPRVYLKEGTYHTRLFKLYGIKSYTSSKLVNRAMKQDSGFNMLCLCDVGFDEQADQIRKYELDRQFVRTHDRFTADSKIGV